MDIPVWMLSLKHWVRQVSIILVITVIAIAAVNIVIALVLIRFPQLEETKSNRITREFNERLANGLRAHSMEWLAIADSADLDAYFVESANAQPQNQLAWEDFTLFKPAPWKGRFFNFVDAGYRMVVNQGPWPPIEGYFNIFFFGGSTAMGVGPDWTTIASYLQAKLTGDRIDGKSVRVYNFGRGAYFSTQERVLFQHLLLSKIRPDAAIFLDGLNDSAAIDGRPYLWQLLAASFETPKTRPWIHAVMDRLTQSPMGRAATIIRDRYSQETPQLPAPVLESSKGFWTLTFKPEPSARPELDGVIDRYIEHKRQVEAISCAYGIRPFFVWQPVPGYKYDLKYHIALNPIYGLGVHMRSGEVYPIAAERRAEFGKSFLWLADIQMTLKEPLYIDSVHYNAKFSELIAARIATFVLEEINSKQERCNFEIRQAIRLQNKFKNQF